MFLQDQISGNDPAQETEETSDDEDVPQQEETEEIANDGHGEADLTDINTFQFCHHDNC